MSDINEPPENNMSAEEIEIMEMETKLNELALQFEQLCQQRHEAGAAEYGVLSFLGNDVIRMMLEELADTSNYCRMQAIKLMLLQERFETGEMTDDLIGDDGNITIGFEAFKGTKDIGWGGRS